jgi:Uma2 family endonuclease
MPTLVLDPYVEERIRAEREASGADRYDEVWEGVYMMAPLADDEHQDLQTQLGGVLLIRVGWTGLGQVRTGVNVSDREKGWKENYRIPDVAVFLPDTTARNCDTFWLGGPDFAIEIVSRGDRGREKLAFYAKVGVRELLLVDRDPWGLEFYQRVGNRMELQTRSTLASPAVITSGILPLTFRLVPGDSRPRIEVADKDGKQNWTL